MTQTTNKSSYKSTQKSTNSSSLLAITFYHARNSNGINFSTYRTRQRPDNSSNARTEEGTLCQRLRVDSNRLSACAMLTARTVTVAPMMYGFGDVNPAPDTINVMEELLIEHITDIVRRISLPCSRTTLADAMNYLDTLMYQCTQAQRIATNKSKIKVEDFKFALRKDAKKLERVDELLFMTEEIARFVAERAVLCTNADATICRARGKDDLTAYVDEGDGVVGKKGVPDLTGGTAKSKPKGKGKAAKA